MGIRVLTTKADHNGTRHVPIPADASMAPSQTSDSPDSPGVFCKQRITSNWSVAVPSACPDEAETRDIEL